MATYGLETKKADNSTVVLQNSSKSGVFARTYTATPNDITYVNTGGGISDSYYNKEFPEYNGRTIYLFMLKPGNSSPYVFKSPTGVNTIGFDISSPSSTFVDPKFTVGLTTVYLFIK